MAAQGRDIVHFETLKELIEQHRFSVNGSRSHIASFSTRFLGAHQLVCRHYLASDIFKYVFGPPYILCDPGSASFSPDANASDIGTKDYKTSQSPFLDLGKLLVELELGELITVIELKKNKEASLWITLRRLIQERVSRSATGDYLAAIEACLSLHRHMLEMPAEEWTAESGKMIYNQIVHNLEVDFSHYRESENPEVEFSHYREPDNMKRKREDSLPSMDLRSRPILTDPFATRPNAETVVPGTRVLLDEPSSNSNDSKGAMNNTQSDIHPEKIATVADRRPEKRPKHTHIATGNSVIKNESVTESSVCINSCGTTILPPTPLGSIKSSDELKSDTAPEQSRVVSSSDDFFDFMDDFIESYLPDDFTEQSQRVKVCIIDSGIDKEHRIIKQAIEKGKIKKTKSFKGDRNDIDDKTGHGTHIAELLTTLAPEAAVYVAKVAVSGTMPPEDTKLIVDAINWALKKDVDIISLSLVLEAFDPDLDSVIKKAYEAGKIVIAAAGNEGNNKSRAYPARNPTVLCIHASNGKGKDGGISPNALPNEDNFMTLGIDIPLIWKRQKVVKSGTSFSAVIAAAIAANLLAIIPRRCSLDEAKLKYLRSSDGMRRIFRVLAELDNGYQYIAPWQLWNQENTDEYIKAVLEKCLSK
ncbi:hypothetical protein TrVFT333_010361 [Trichoderma virens FT-333]|nr:hypothetical protein TrVFT333_010361 [Trichoderma virens FT-333]